MMKNIYEDLAIQLTDDFSYLGFIRKEDDGKRVLTQDRGRSFVLEKGLSEKNFVPELMRQIVLPEIESFVVSKIYKFALENNNSYLLDEKKIPQFVFKDDYFCFLNIAYKEEVLEKFKIKKPMPISRWRMFTDFNFMSDENGGVNVSKNAKEIMALIFHRDAVDFVVNYYFKKIKGIYNRDSNKPKILFRTKYDAFLNETFKNKIFAIIKD